MAVPRLDRDDDAPITLTHARLRAAQGDLDAARRILAAILVDSPGNPEATALLAAIRASSVEPPGGEPEGDARRARLERWQESIRRRRGVRRDAR
jgi:hypothetical protein